MTEQRSAAHADGSSGSVRPILFLDVDGPLNPFEARSWQLPGYVTHFVRPPTWVASRGRGWRKSIRAVRPLRLRLNPAHGPALLSLPVELVWATTWGHDANVSIGPRIGLPQLAVVEWPEPIERLVRQETEGLFWKTRTLAAYAGRRPFAWIDDWLTPADWRWCAEHHPAPTLLLPIDAGKGLRDSDIAALDRWARHVTAT